HGVIREGLRPVDDAMTHLMIPRGGDAEAFADRAFLLPALLPPGALELEDVERPLVELRSASPGGVPGYVISHTSRLTTLGWSARKGATGTSRASCGPQRRAPRRASWRPCASTSSSAPRGRGRRCRSAP